MGLAQDVQIGYDTGPYQVPAVGFRTWNQISCEMPPETPRRAKECTGPVLAELAADGKCESLWCRQCS